MCYCLTGLYCNGKGLHAAILTKKYSLHGK